MIVDKLWKLTNTVRVGLDVRSSVTPHTHRDNPLSRIMCAPIAPVVVCYTLKFASQNEQEEWKTNTGEGRKGKRGRTVSDDTGGKSLSDTSTSTRGQCVGESSTCVKSRVNCDTWLGTGNVRREFAVSSAHACVQSVRKNIREDMEDRWITNLSEDRKRFYLVSSLLDPLTKMLSFCDTVTSTSPPGKTIPSVIFQWTWKVFTCSLLREKWKTRMDKSSIVVIWTNSWIWVPYPWISTWSLSKGKSSFNRTYKSNRCPTTQTLWCDGYNISNSFPTWPECLDSTWQYLPLLRLLRGSSVVWNLYRLTCVGVFWTPPWLTWCGINRTLDHLGRDEQRGHTHHTHTHTHTHYLLSHWHTGDPYIFTFLCVSHTNTVEVLLNLTHHIPGPTLLTINLVAKRSLLIRSCW
jgi:hypothetical protein